MSVFIVEQVLRKSPKIWFSTIFPPSFPSMNVPLTGRRWAPRYRCGRSRAEGQANPGWSRILGRYAGTVADGRSQTDLITVFSRKRLCKTSPEDGEWESPWLGELEQFNVPRSGMGFDASWKYYCDVTCGCNSLRTRSHVLKHQWWLRMEILWHNKTHCNNHWPPSLLHSWSGTEM